MGDTEDTVHRVALADDTGIVPAPAVNALVLRALADDPASALTYYAIAAAAILADHSGPVRGLAARRHHLRGRRRRRPDRC
jgi:hypothetical protein